jgi:hypothetical protein
MELIEVKSLTWAQKGINEKNWFAERRFFVGVHWMEFVSHVKFRRLQTQR